MDPRLSESMMRAGLLPNLEKLRAGGGFSRLGTSTPPQSPVAWANFINGAGPGSHGIFDFIHRHPQEQCDPFYSAAETLPGDGYWEVGEHRLQLDFWPFNHKPPQTVLRRQGTPFWDYLDAAGVRRPFTTCRRTTRRARRISATTAAFAAWGRPTCWGRTARINTSPRTPRPSRRRRGRKAVQADLRKRNRPGPFVGPENSLLKIRPRVDRAGDPPRSRGQRRRPRGSGSATLAQARQWSRWTRLDFELSTPWFVPSRRQRHLPVLPPGAGTVLSGSM